MSAWELWLRFAVESNAITPEEHTDLAALGRTAANELIASQALYQIDRDNTAQRFLVSLKWALAAGNAHIADQKNDVPQMPSLWGWKSAGQRWIPCGARIGWLSGNELFLDSRAAFEVARETAGPDRLTITEQKMRRRLHERGLLASIDGARKTLLIRRQLGQCARHVLHLKAKDLLPTSR